MNREVVFISHATPDDNDFVRWLGTRLTGHGYRVWADLFDLKGGTPFWTTIESALRSNACKMIFVVSKASVSPDRTGVRNELSVADAMKKTLRDSGFVIPIRIDDTPFSEFPIQIHQLNAIDFSKGWGEKLAELLDTLDDAKVPRFPGDQTAEFDNWRATIARTSTIVESAPEQVLTNLLPIISLPQHITFFEQEGDSGAIASILKGSGIPFSSFYRLIISFADLPTIQDPLPPPLRLKVRAQVPFSSFLTGTVKEVTAPLKDDAHKIATSLLKQHVERFLLQKGLKRFDTSTSASFYFPSGLIPNDKIRYVAASGRNTYKNVVGLSKVNKVNWHLAMKVNVVLGSNAVIRFKPYVCFSEDGQAAIKDPKRTSAIRRRFCKNWWNQHWRQLQEAFCVFLIGDATAVVINLDGPEQLTIAGKLLELTATRKMPGDFKFAEEPDDPPEPEDPLESDDSQFDDGGYVDNPDLEEPA